MTYSHALRYLTAATSTDQVAAAPPLTVKFPHAPLVLCFTRNQLGSAAAADLAAVLKESGIGYLHWIDDDILEPKSRFLMDGRPISPPTLALHTAHWQAAARAQGREPTAAERCAGVLSLCAAEADCRVILLESPLSVCHVGLFCAINKRTRAITLLSDGSTVARTAYHPATVEIVTPAFGRAMHGLITDICAQNDCKMVPIAASATQRTDVTLGAQTILYQAKSGGRVAYRLASASRLAADAATIALYAIHSLELRGFAIPDEAVRRGLLGVALPHCGTVYCMQPLILTYAVSSEEELAFALSDIQDLPCMQPPPALWSAPSLPALSTNLSLYDQETWPQDLNYPLLLIGPSAWIEQKLAERTRKKGKNNDKI